MGMAGGKMSRIRVQTHNAAVMCEVLRQQNFEASFVLGARTSMDGGCGDPQCCHQHHCAGDTSWSTIESTASGTQAHKLWVKAGIVT